MSLFCTSCGTIVALSHIDLIRKHDSLNHVMTFLSIKLRLFKFRYVLSYLIQLVLGWKLHKFVVPFFLTLLDLCESWFWLGFFLLYSSLLCLIEFFIFLGMCPVWGKATTSVRTIDSDIFIILVVFLPELTAIWLFNDILFFQSKNWLFFCRMWHRCHGRSCFRYWNRGIMVTDLIDLAS